MLSDKFPVNSKDPQPRYTDPPPSFALLTGEGFYYPDRAACAHRETDG